MVYMYTPSGLGPSIHVQSFVCLKGKERGRGRLQVGLSPVKKFSKNGKYSMFNNILETEFPSCPYRRKFMALHLLWHFT